jgi:hypothetical protein
MKADSLVAFFSHTLTQDAALCLNGKDLDDLAFLIDTRIMGAMGVTEEAAGLYPGNAVFINGTILEDAEAYLIANTCPLMSLQRMYVLF